MATRVHIIEPGWNPMLELQAVDRVHRLGQTKEVTSISYVVSGSDSVEEVAPQFVHSVDYPLILILSVYTEKAGVEVFHDRGFTRIQ